MNTSEIIEWLDFSLNTQYPHVISGTGARGVFQAIKERLIAAERMAEALKFYYKNCPQNSLDGQEGTPTCFMARESLNEWNEAGGKK